MQETHCSLYSVTLLLLLMCLLSGNSGGVFSIDNATGIIFIARDLDPTCVGSYSLTVGVTDSGFPPLIASSFVHISLILSEFSTPKFTRSEYQAEVREHGDGAG